MKIKTFDGRKDRRHGICACITLLSVLLGFLFPNSIPRLIQSLWDLVTSVAFYFVRILFRDSTMIQASINELQLWDPIPQFWQRVTFLPESFEEFLNFWSAYLQFLFSWYNFRSYWYAIVDLIYYSSRIMMLIVPLGAVVVLLFMKAKRIRCTDRGLESPALIKFKAFLYKRYYPLRAYWISFRSFLKDNPRYVRSWCVIWSLHFNFISIAVSLIAYYFYFVSSWDLISIYTQLLKLQRDLTPVIRFIPGLIWLILFCKLYNWICRLIAFDNLYAAERANKSVMRSLPIISALAGIPGAGKTMLATSMAQTSQGLLYEDAFSIMEARVSQFPNFPWQRFRDEIEKAVDRRKIVDISSAKNWVSSRRRFYDMIVRKWPPVVWQHHRTTMHLFDYTFGYDYLHYRSAYSDELKVIHLFDALESYAAAYLIYAVETNIIFSNYSIREDNILYDEGNLPLRDADYFKRDPWTQHLYSQYSHIFDFNVIRLGKKMKNHLEKSNGAPVGVIVITEIDKEFKNMQLLKETKINDDEVNQKNDLHDAALMMIRHGSMIDYKPFVRVIADLQRPEAWGAGGRELGNVIFIADKSKMLPALPFFSTYWLTEGVFSFLDKKWNAYYADYCYRRSDETLPIFIVRNVMSSIRNHYDRLNGLFGMQELLLEVQSGRLDGETIKERWIMLSKKDYSKRALTDCLQSVWVKSEPNKMHIDDFQQYAGELATIEECDLQNSFFQKDVHKIKENN